MMCCTVRGFQSETSWVFSSLSWRSEYNTIFKCVSQFAVLSQTYSGLSSVLEECVYLTFKCVSEFAVFSQTHPGLSPVMEE